jgi:hypothetical protein
MIRLTFILLWRIGRAPNSIPIYSYIQHDATLHSLFISGNCSTCFGWYFHPSSGAHTTVSTASGNCHNTVTAICRYRGRVGAGLSVLWVWRRSFQDLLKVRPSSDAGKLSRRKHTTQMQLTKLRGLSPRANYSDRAAAAGRRS